MSDIGMWMALPPEVFSICRTCGVPVSLEMEHAQAMGGTWVDVTGGDCCGDGVHEALVPPPDGTPLVFVQEHQIDSAVRIRIGRHATFLYVNPDESGEWYVTLRGENGSLSRVVSVHPNTVEVDE